MNVCSSAGKRPSLTNAAYSVTKAAQLSLSRVFADAHAAEGVLVNAGARCRGDAAAAGGRRPGRTGVAAAKGISRDEAIEAQESKIPTGRSQSLRRWRGSWWCSALRLPRTSPVRPGRWISMEPFRSTFEAGLRALRANPGPGWPEVPCPHSSPRCCSCPRWLSAQSPARRRFDAPLRAHFGGADTRPRFPPAAPEPPPPGCAGPGGAGAVRPAAAGCPRGRREAGPAAQETTPRSRPRCRPPRTRSSPEAQPAPSQPSTTFGLASTGFAAALLGFLGLAKLGVWPGSASPAAQRAGVSAVPRLLSRRVRLTDDRLRAPSTAANLSRTTTGRPASRRRRIDRTGRPRQPYAQSHGSPSARTL